MNFEQTLRCAQNGDERAVMIIMQMYRPLLIKNAIVNGQLDEDLYQELCIVALKCIKGFRW